jgi:hypothetical protein
MENISLNGSRFSKSPPFRATAEENVMANKIVTLLAAVAAGAVATAAQATIVSINSGTTVMGNRAANLIANGSFEIRNPLDPPLPP